MSTDDHEDDGPSVETLVQEMAGDIDHSLTLGGIPDRKGGALFTRKHDPIHFFALIAAATEEPHIPSGRALMDALEDVVGRSYSPGTVYPVLHDLHGVGLLDRETLVRTKAYTVGDPAAVDAALAGYERELEWYLEAVREARAELDVEK